MPHGGSPLCCKPGLPERVKGEPSFPSTDMYLENTVPLGPGVGVEDKRWGAGKKVSIRYLRRKRQNVRDRVSRPIHFKVCLPPSCPVPHIPRKKDSSLGAQFVLKCGIRILHDFCEQHGLPASSVRFLGALKDKLWNALMGKLRSHAGFH